MRSRSTGRPWITCSWKISSASPGVTLPYQTASGETTTVSPVAHRPRQPAELIRTRPFSPASKASCFSRSSASAAPFSAQQLAVNPQVFDAIQELLDEVPIEQVSHEDFKRRTASAVAVVRTGEFTPYANIILIAGVVF